MSKEDQSDLLKKIPKLTSKIVPKIVPSKEGQKQANGEKEMLKVSTQSFIQIFSNILFIFSHE